MMGRTPLKQYPAELSSNLDAAVGHCARALRRAAIAEERAIVGDFKALNAENRARDDIGRAVDCLVRALTNLDGKQDDGTPVARAENESEAA